MIATTTEYERAQEELHALEQRLAKLQHEHPFGSKAFAKAGVRRMIARIHEELAELEGSHAAPGSDS